MKKKRKKRKKKEIVKTIVGFLRERGGGRKIFKENVVMRHCTGEVATGRGEAWAQLAVPWGWGTLLRPRQGEPFC